MPLLFLRKYLHFGNVYVKALQSRKLLLHFLYDKRAE